jgi:hypothetical protein
LKNKHSDDIIDIYTISIKDNTLIMTTTAFNMTTSQGLIYTNNVVLNDKGANAWKSTLNPLVDLFATGIKRCPDTYEEFEKIFNIVQSALREDPQSFIKVLKFHRLIANGNGIKWIYYLCLLVIRMEDSGLYSQVLEWSWQYPKDFLNLHRITNMYEPLQSGYEVNTTLPSIDLVQGSYASKLNAWALQNKVERHKNLNLIYSVPVQNEIVSYGNKVYELFNNLMTPEFEDNYNPMFLKYLSYESGHWEVETHLIWQYIETKFIGHKEFRDLINSNSELKTDLGTELRAIFKDSLNLMNSHQNQGLFTNKTRRLIKKCFNSHINLLDNLFKGIHQDGSAFGSQSKEKEINDIAFQLKRSATLAFNRFEKTVRTYSEMREDNTGVVDTSIVKQYLAEGYQKYLQMLKEGKAQVKTTGLDASQQVWEFFNSSETFSQSVESKLEDLVSKLKISLIETSGTALFNQLAQRFSLVLDISMSMDGTPIQTGLLYMVLMVKVFGIRKLYYFESNLHHVELRDEDLSGTLCGLVKKIYKRTQGCTNLESVFTHFKSSNIRDKNVIIITDGDCDPSDYGSANPFHTAPKREQNLKYIVVNVKETKMNFPYLGMDPDVCYVSGNNPKTLNGLIKALIVSLIQNVPLTPTLVLSCSLDLDELVNTFDVGTFSNVYEEDTIQKVFQVFMKNKPPAKTDTNSDSESDSQSISRYQNTLGGRGGRGRRSGKGRISGRSQLLSQWTIPGYGGRL